MAIRTDKAAVRAIAPALESTLDAVLDAYILAASIRVDKLALGACGSVLADDVLKEIETWLTAHLGAISTPSANAVMEEKFEGSMKIYAIKQLTGEGVLSTAYGNMANELSCGCLVEQGKRRMSLAGFI